MSNNDLHAANPAITPYLHAERLFAGPLMLRVRQRTMIGNIHIESGSFELLPKIEKLWYALKGQQAGYASDFCDMSTPSFEIRQNGLREKSKALLVEIAIDQHLNTQAGYCFSIVDHAETGEVESLFIKEEYRRCGIGRELVTRANYMDGSEKC